MMQARLTRMLPDDADFVESCFLGLRNAAPDQGAETCKRAFLTVYRVRHGAVRREVSNALDEAKFGNYVELLASESADDIAAALLPSKGPTS